MNREDGQQKYFLVMATIQIWTKISIIQMLSVMNTKHKIVRILDVSGIRLSGIFCAMLSRTHFRFIPKGFNSDVTL